MPRNCGQGCRAGPDGSPDDSSPISVSSRPVSAAHRWRWTRWGAVIGLICGLVYAFGGLWVDATTVGLNGGTALAFLAMIGMPLLFALAGFVLDAVLWTIQQHRHRS